MQTFIIEYAVPFDSKETNGKFSRLGTILSVFIVTGTGHRKVQRRENEETTAQSRNTALRQQDYLDPPQRNLPRDPFHSQFRSTPKATEAKSWKSGSQQDSTIQGSSQRLHLQTVGDWKP